MIKSLFQKLFGLSQTTPRTRSLSRNAIAIFLIHGFSFLCSFLISFSLARLLGADGYGVFTFAFSLVSVFGILGGLGLQGLLVREVSALASQQNWKLLKGLLRWSGRNILRVSIGLVIIGEGVTLGLHIPADPDMNRSISLALLALPFLSLTGMEAASLRGFHRSALGQIPEKVVRPAVFLLGLLGFYMLDLAWKVHWIIELNVVAFIVMFIAGFILLSRSIPETVKASTSRYQAQHWWKSGLTFLLISGMHVIESKTDVIMLGSLAEADDVGIYHIAKRLSTILTALLTIVNLVLAPTMSELFSNNQLPKLQTYLTKSTRGVFFMTLPLALLLVTFNQQVLQLFGTEFTEGNKALIVLCGGQLINIMAGSVGYLLAMTGYEKSAARGVGGAIVINIGLNAILIPYWGVTGAAVATAVSIVAWNLFLARQVVRKTGLYPTVFGTLLQSNTHD